MPIGAGLQEKLRKIEALVFGALSTLRPRSLSLQAATADDRNGLPSSIVLQRSALARIQSAGQGAASVSEQRDIEADQGRDLRRHE